MQLFQQGSHKILILSTGRSTRILKNTHEKPLNEGSFSKNLANLQLTWQMKKALGPFLGTNHQFSKVNKTSRKIYNVEGFYQVVYTINK
jgi:hypothetical protein